MNTLEATARRLVEPGKGILAADESTPTITKRFQSIKIPSTEENRRAYREALFSTTGLGEFISGVILYDETLRQSSSNGVPFPELLARQGIIPGIKVDKGAKALAGFAAEKVTEGLDGLRERLIDYRNLGAKFTKWRAVIAINENIPTVGCLRANAHALARFAALSQEAGLVPIVEPEVLMDGNHALQRCECVTELTLNIVFEELFQFHIAFESMLLKPNMVVAGKESGEQPPPEIVAEATFRVLRRTVPAAVPGVVFLSGGLSPEAATRNLNALNKLRPAPWQLSFSFGRALQEPALKAWQGLFDNVPAARAALHLRARLNGLARYGRYTGETMAVESVRHDDALLAAAQI